MPPIDPERALSNGLFEARLLRARVILRLNCQYGGQTLLELERDYPTKQEWADLGLPGTGSRRLYRAARGRSVRGDAEYFDAQTGKELPLWPALETHHPGLIRFVQPWMFVAVDPSVRIDWSVAKPLIDKWPAFLRRQCCERVEESPARGWVLRYVAVSERLVERFAMRTEIEGPFAALLLTRLLYSNGAEADFFRVRRRVLAAIYVNRDVGYAFAEDKDHLMRLAQACLTTSAESGAQALRAVDFGDYILDLTPRKNAEEERASAST